LPAAHLQSEAAFPPLTPLPFSGYPDEYTLPEGFSRERRWRVGARFFGFSRAAVFRHQFVLGGSIIWFPLLTQAVSLLSLGGMTRSCEAVWALRRWSFPSRRARLPAGISPDRIIFLLSVDEGYLSPGSRVYCFGF